MRSTSFHNFTQTVSPYGNQMFEHMNPWGTFYIQIAALALDDRNFSGGRDEGSGGEFPEIHSAEALCCGTFNLDIRILGVQLAVVMLCLSAGALAPAIPAYLLHRAGRFFNSQLLYRGHLRGHIRRGGSRWITPRLSPAPGQCVAPKHAWSPRKQPALQSFEQGSKVI